MGFFRRYRVDPGDKARLDKLDTRGSEHVDRDLTKTRTRGIVERISDLQYLLHANAERSLLVVLQGPDASGKDGLIRHLFAGVNPQGVRVVAFAEPSEVEARHDFLWRVHRRAPAKGQIAVFNRSHYEAVLVERVHRLVSRETWTERYGMINSFEALLAQNGTAILKFYLHISADEQLERFRRRLDDTSRHWKIDEADYADRERWRDFEEAANDMLERTSTKIAPWFVIPSDHKWYRDYAVSRIILRSLKRMHLHTPPAEANIGAIRRKFHDAANR